LQLAAKLSSGNNNTGHCSNVLVVGVHQTYWIYWQRYADEQPAQRHEQHKLW
jgi:hypothetical protein